MAQRTSRLILACPLLLLASAAKADPGPAIAYGEDLHTGAAVAAQAELLQSIVAGEDTALSPAAEGVLGAAGMSQTTDRRFTRDLRALDPETGDYTTSEGLLQDDSVGSDTVSVDGCSSCGFVYYGIRLRTDAATFPEQVARTASDLLSTAISNPAASLGIAAFNTTTNALLGVTASVVGEEEEANSRAVSGVTGAAATAVSFVNPYAAAAIVGTTFVAQNVEVYVISEEPNLTGRFAQDLPELYFSGGYGTDVAVAWDSAGISGPTPDERAVEEVLSRLNTGTSLLQIEEIDPDLALELIVFGDLPGIPEATVRGMTITEDGERRAFIGVVDADGNLLSFDDQTGFVVEGIAMDLETETGAIQLR